MADRLECEPSEITMDSTFHDLGIDSLDTVDLLMELEDKLDISIELDEKVETVGRSRKLRRKTSEVRKEARS